MKNSFPGLHIALLRTTSMKEVQDELQREVSLAEHSITLLDIDLGTRVGRWDSGTAEFLAKNLQRDGRTDVLLIYSTDIQPANLGGKIKAAFTDSQFAHRVEASNTDVSSEDAPSALVRAARELWVRNHRTSLERLWELSGQRLRSDGVIELAWFNEEEPHSGQRSSVVLHEPSDEELTSKAYQEAVAAALGWDLPESWVCAHGHPNITSLRCLHLHLKHLCGAGYYGTGGTKYNLNVGSVLVIAMMAYHRSHRTIEPFLEVLPSWDMFPELARPFLGKQSSQEARLTALSLFDLFKELSKSEPRRSASGAASQLSFCEIQGGGAAFSLIFNWAGSGLYRSLSDLLRPVDGGAETGAHLKWPRDRSNTVCALRWVLHYLSLQEDGFSHPGHLYMIEETLRVVGGYALPPPEPVVEEPAEPQ
jgi:hypothetical protein